MRGKQMNRSEMVEALKKAMDNAFITLKERNSFSVKIENDNIIL